MRVSVGTSQIFNIVQENQSPIQASVRSSVASRPSNSINWFIFWHLFIITRTTFSLLVRCICIPKLCETGVAIVVSFYISIRVLKIFNGLALD
jgi:hypothetical protein